MSCSAKSALHLFVDRLDQRSHLSGEEADALLNMSGNTSVSAAHRDIVSVGETTKYATLVLDGLAGRFGVVIDGQRQITALHVAGDMCDLHALVAPEAGWAIQALAPTAILRIPHHQIREIARRFPNVAEAFWRDCSVDASILSEWIVNVGRRDARARLAHLLCEMAVRMENAGLGTRDKFQFQATQSQLGDALGLTPVHVNRTIRALREMNLLTIHGHEVGISDWDAMATLGDFYDAYLKADAWAHRSPPQRAYTSNWAGRQFFAPAVLDSGHR